MANGDITHIKELGRSPLPGGGHTLTGVAKNHKVMVWGEISGSWADGTTGLNLSAKGGVRALGLETLDFVSFNVRTVDGTANVDEAIHTAEFDVTNNIIVVVVDGLTNPTAGNVCVVRYFAIGDGIAAAELT